MRGEGLISEAVSEDALSEEDLAHCNKITLFADNSHWEGECGEICPMRWRKTLDDRGVGNYEWFPELQDARKKLKKRVGRGEPEVKEFKPLQGEAVRFRIAKRCRNTGCVNSQKYEERLQYIVP